MKQLVLSLIVVFFNSQLTSGQSLEAARKELGRENYFKAKQLLFAAAKQPNAAMQEVYYYLGNAYLNSDDADSAKVFYLQSAALNPKSAIGNVATGRIALLAKNTTDAKNAFERALQTSRYKSASIYYEVGEAWFRPAIVDLKQAIANLEEAYKLEPRNTSVLLALGDAYLEQSDNTQAGGQALTKYEEATAVDKTLVEAFVRVARLNLRARIYDEAIKNYEQAIKLDAYCAICYKELGEAYYWTRNYDKVASNFSRYSELNPDDKEAKTKLAGFYFGNKEYEKCLAECQKNLVADPNNYYYLRMIAFSNYELKRPKDGYEAMKKFWAIPDKKVKASDWIYSARLAAANNDTSQALSYFHEALKAEPNDCDLLGEYAKTLYMAKRYDEAIQQYAAKFAKCQVAALDLFNLGKAYYFKNDFVMADTTFAQFIQRTPTTPEGWFWRAKSNLRQETAEVSGLALPFYLKFIELASADPQKNKKNLLESYVYVAANYAGNNDKESARVYLSKAKELDPSDPMIAEIEKGL